MSEVAPRPDNTADTTGRKPEVQFAVQVRLGDGTLWTSQPVADRGLAEKLLSGLQPVGEAWIAKRTVLAGEWERL